MKFQAPHSPKGDANRFCGPAVISSLTGMSTGAAARLIRQQTGRKCVMGTFTNEVRAALNSCGIFSDIVADYSTSDAPTFAQWVKQPRDSGTVYLIAYANHWALVRGRRYVCGLTKEVVGFDHPAIKRRGRVTTVIRLLDKQSGLVIPAAADKPKPKPVNPARRRFVEFAKNHDIDWELPYRGCDVPIVWGIHGIDFDGLDPYEGEHEAYSWEDALDRAERYVDMMRRHALVAA